MKDKIKIIFLSSFVMTKSRWFEREMNYLDKYSDIEIHELCDFLFPKIRTALKDSYQSKRIVKFKTFSDWKNYVLNLRKKCIKEVKKLAILTELSRYPWQGYNLKYIKVHQFLKQSRIDYYEFNDSGSIPSNVSSKTYLRFLKIFKYWRYSLIRLNELSTSFFGSLLDVKPKGIFVAGGEIKKKLENLKKIKDVELINFNAWNYSSTVNKKNDPNLFKKKYAVFVNKVGPKKEAEEMTINSIKPVDTVEKWYPALNNFCSYLEKIFKLEIIIASHPKSNEEGCIDYLGNRTAVLNKTEELIRGSEFVIGKNSTALIFAIVYKKPILFIYSNETKKHIVSFNSINGLSNYFKTKAINIDENISESHIKSLINFDEKLYENYIADFLASDPKNKNYQIILDYLNK